MWSFSKNAPPELRVRLVMRSRNRKTGPIPVSMSSRSTCPPSCPWYERGCYAEQYLGGLQWRRLDAGEGQSWQEFLSSVLLLPAGQLWRHNEAGDLPGEGDAIDERMLRQLAWHARHTRGFTYTHKPVLGDSVQAVRNRAVVAAVAVAGGGFVVNLSADGLCNADDLADLGIAPVTVVLPEDSRAKQTPAKRKVVYCPATTTSHLTCLECRLCAVPGRKAIVAFVAHGCGRRKVTRELVQLKLFGRLT